MTIDGWYSDVEPLGDAERRAIAEAPQYDEALKQQLAVGGRMVLPVGTDDQWLYVVDRKENGFVEQKCAAVRFVPLLPGLA